jgi:hypothetical protein
LAVFTTALLKYRVNDLGKKEREKTYLGRPSDAGLIKTDIWNSNEEKDSLNSLY